MFCVGSCSELQSAVTDNACTQLQLHSEVAATPDLSVVNQSATDAGFPDLSSWSYPACRCVDDAACTSSGGEVYRHSVGVATTTTMATPVGLLPCNVQQRLVCGGGVVQYHSQGGALQYDSGQQRALSDISGNYV